MAVRPAVLGAIAIATLPLAQTAIIERPSLWLTVIAGAITVLSLVALIRFKTPTWQLVLAGGGLGLLVGLIIPTGLSS